MNNISLSLIINFIRFLGKSKILEIAKNIGFFIRQPKLEPDTIVKVFTFGLWNIPNPSLSQIASKCEDIQPGLKITRNRIAQRLQSSAKLLKEVFRMAVEYSAGKATAVTTSGILSSFTDVKICDSTKITLPDKLSDIWEGLGGNNAKAALKIQTIYSLKTKSIYSMELTKAPGTDASYRDELLKQIKPGELLIVDLGYYSKTLFQDIALKGAYYLSRIKKNAVFHIQKAGEKGFEKLNLPDILKDKMVVDMDVLFGANTSNLLKCRLIAIRLPEHIADERRRKAHAKAKGRTLSKYESVVLGFNILITDAPREMLGAEAACILYRGRWQIEILFKACKSHLNIDKVGSCGEKQLECLLYGRLTASILMFAIYSPLYRFMLTKRGRRVSAQSFIKIVATKADVILRNLLVVSTAINELAHVFQRVAEQSFHDTRKRKTMDELLYEDTYGFD